MKFKICNFFKKKKSSEWLGYIRNNYGFMANYPKNKEKN